MTKPLVDIAPYPFHLPQGQELLRILGETYPRPTAVEQIALQAGYSLDLLPLEKPARDILYRMLADGATAKRVRKLVEVVLENEPQHVRADFLRLALTEPPGALPIDAAPAAGAGGAGGRSAFLRGSAVLADQEALLFHDDLMITVESIPRLTALLGKLHDAGRAVCRLRTSGPEIEQHGTGFRIGADLVLTNWHVLRFDGQPTTAVEARFHYDDDGAGEAVPTLPLRGDLQTIAGDQTADWAVIRLSDPIPGDVPTIALTDLPEPQLDEPAYIVQHPGGRPKRVAFVRNRIFFCDDMVVQYLSDTQQGSSGAPVFDKDCRLIALHRQGGTPQAKAGKPPMKKNEGLRASVIAQGLADRGLNVG